jgi:predicted MFS family arabinose efflux permease
MTDASAVAPKTSFSNLTLTALVLFAAITPLALLVAPALAAQLAGELGVGPAEIGRYFFVENGAFSFASLVSIFWLGKINIRLVSMIAIAVFGVGNLVTAFLLPEFGTLLIMRAITGLGGGTLMVLSMVSAQDAENPDRIFGFWVIGQLILGAIGLAVLPLLFADFGLREFYLILGVVTLLLSPLVRGFRTPAAAETGAEKTGITARFVFVIFFALGALLLYYVAIGGAWTFVSSAAERAGLAPERIGPVLSIATLFGILGAGVATWMGGRSSRRLSLFVGYAILVVSLAALSVDTVWIYIAAICAFKFAWTFALPFIIAEISSCDASGRLVAATTLIIGLGLSLGPLFAGNMLAGGWDLGTVMLLAAVCSVLSLIGLILTPKTQTQTPEAE